MSPHYTNIININGNLLWQHFIDIENWPRWILNLKKVSIDGEFKIGSILTLHNIDGTIYNCEIKELIIKKKEFQFSYSKLFKNLSSNENSIIITSTYNFKSIDENKTILSLNRNHPGCFQLFYNNFFNPYNNINDKHNHIDNFLNYVKKNYIIKIKKENMMIDEQLAQQLINLQFPEYSELKINKIKNQGHDNTTFNLGDKLIISLPNGPQYARRIDKYYQFLPEVQNYVKIHIPSILHVGRPSSLFPHYWTISKWIDGKSTNFMIDKIDLNTFASELASVLLSFKSIYFKSEHLIPSKANWYRGGDLSKYNKEVIKALEVLDNKIENEIILKIWNHALTLKYEDKGIFVHGDIALGNIIYEKSKLSGLIDFGTMCIGDPACDLMIAYTVFNGNSRTIFKNIISYDKNTWIRAMGWTLWKALIELTGTSKSNAKDWENPKKVINEIIEDYKNYV